jgi:hypothetical protein
MLTWVLLIHGQLSIISANGSVEALSSKILLNYIIYIFET